MATAQLLRTRERNSRSLAAPKSASRTGRAGQPAAGPGTVRRSGAAAQAGRLLFARPPGAVQSPAGHAQRRSADRRHVAARTAEEVGRPGDNRRPGLPGRGGRLRTHRGQRRLLRRHRQRQGHVAVADPRQHGNPERRVRSIAGEPRITLPRRGTRVPHSGRSRRRRTGGIAGRAARGADADRCADWKKGAAWGACRPVSRTWTA